MSSHAFKSASNNTKRNFHCKHTSQIGRKVADWYLYNSWFPNKISKRISNSTSVNVHTIRCTLSCKNVEESVIKKLPSCLASVRPQNHPLNNQRKINFNPQPTTARKSGIRIISINSLQNIKENWWWFLFLERENQMSNLQKKAHQREVHVFVSIC